MLIKISLLMFAHGCMGLFQFRQMPQPDLTNLRDDTGTLPCSNEYLPAVMQSMHYYIEMMQYEQIPSSTPKPVTTKRPSQTRPPIRDPTTSTTRRPAVIMTTTTTRRPVTTLRPITTTRRTTTTKRPVTTTTTRRQTTTTTRRIVTTTRRPITTTKKPVIYQDTTKAPQEPMYQQHTPGIFAPIKPPYYSYYELPAKPEENYHKPGVQQPVFNSNNFNSPNPLNWQDPTFVSWFFQPKPPKIIDEINENDLKYLDNSPKRLLLDIINEPYHQPAITDMDNVNEFRKKFDDSFYRSDRKNEPNMQMLKMNMRLQMQRQRAMLTGKKKAPPTRPYVLMVMLYDLLKREAKRRNLHHFGGYSRDLLEELHAHSQTTGVSQMMFLYNAMLDSKEVTELGIVKRVKDILKDLEDPKTDAYKALTMIPPLQFTSGVDDLNYDYCTIKR